MSSNTLTYQDQKYRLQLIATLDKQGREALRNVFHNIYKFPKTPAMLYKELKKTVHEEKLKKLLKKKTLSLEQWKLIYPSTQETDSKNFDITLLRLLIRNCTPLPPPIKGWGEDIDESDYSKAACIVRLVELRNKLFHSPTIDLTEEEFDDYWFKLSQCLRGIDSRINIAAMKNLPLESQFSEETLNTINGMMKTSGCLACDCCICVAVGT